MDHLALQTNTVGLFDKPTSNIKPTVVCIGDVKTKLFSKVSFLNYLFSSAGKRIWCIKGDLWISGKKCESNLWNSFKFLFLIFFISSSVKNMTANKNRNYRKGYGHLQRQNNQHVVVVLASHPSERLVLPQFNFWFLIAEY